jgi:RecG-like helicase
MAKKLVDRLKIALGRQLSPKKMANAKELGEFNIMVYSGKSTKIELRIRPSGEFVRFKQRFDYMESDYIPNTKNYYLSRAVVEVYDSKGRIKEKTVSKNVWGGHGDNITMIFNPPGRLIGERSESSR